MIQYEGALCLLHEGELRDPFAAISIKAASEDEAITQAIQWALGEPCESAFLRITLDGRIVAVFAPGQYNL